MVKPKASTKQTRGQLRKTNKPSIYVKKNKTFGFQLIFWPVCIKVLFQLFDYHSAVFFYFHPFLIFLSRYWLENFFFISSNLLVYFYLSSGQFEDFSLINLLVFFDQLLQRFGKFFTYAIVTPILISTYMFIRA